MFTSDAWFWDDPIRPETRQNLRCAARAVRLVDGIAGTRLERALAADLALFTSPRAASTAPRSTALRSPMSASRGPAETGLLRILKVDFARPLLPGCPDPGKN